MFSSSKQKKRDKRSSAKPEHYDTAAQYYREGRLDYAPLFIRRAARMASVGPDSTVLDLGCGPGTIANEIAQYCGRVLAVDISEAMLEAGREHAPDNVTFIKGSSDKMTYIDGPLQLVTFGRSFHWMSRKHTLQLLDDHVAPGGCLAFFYVAPFSANSPAHKWWIAVRRMANSLDVGEREVENPLGKNAEREEILLAKSPFSRVNIFATIEPYDWTMDNLVAWVRSRYRTGVADADAQDMTIRTKLGEVLAPYGPGPWRTYNQQKLIIARRPV